MPNTYAIDTETTLIPDLGGAPLARATPEFVCLSYCGRQAHGVLQGEAARSFVLWVLEQDDSMVVMHNSAFDIAVLCRAFPEHTELWKKLLREGRLRDTLPMYGFRDVSEGRRLALDAAAWRVLGVRLEKGDVRTSFRVGQTLSPEQERYAARDAEVTLRLYDALLRTPFGELTRLRVKHVTPYPVAPALLAQELNWDEVFSCASAWKAFVLEATGLGVDLDMCRQLAGEQEAKTLELQDSLIRAGLAERVRDTKSPKTVAPGLPYPARKWAWCDALKAFARGTEVQAARVKLCAGSLRDAYREAAEELELDDVPTSPKTGEISLDYNYWKQFSRELPEKCRAHMDFQRATKLLGTYFRPILSQSAVAGRRRAVVFGTYGVGFAETGRWTSWRPNMQNQPKALRKMYVAPEEGNVLVSADYKSLEIYTLAQALASFGIEGPLLQALRDQKDIHTLSAARVYGIDESEVTPAMRQGAKACNFGLPGGMGARRFHALCRRQYGLDWTFSEAAEARENWFRAYPDVEEFLARFRISPSFVFREPGQSYRDWLLSVGLDPDEQYTRWDLGRYLNDGRIYDVTLPSGRRLPNRRFSQAANLYFQGPGAEIVTLAFVLLAELDCSVVAVVHDSITLQCRPEDAQRQAELLSMSMVTAQARCCPAIRYCLPSPEVVISEHWS